MSQPKHFGATPIGFANGQVMLGGALAVMNGISGLPARHPEALRRLTPEDMRRKIAAGEKRLRRERTALARQAADAAVRALRAERAP